MDNFIIVGTPRTGSSVLAQLINFHPEVVCGWQWTAGIPWWKKIRAAQRGLNGDYRQLSMKNRTYMEDAYTPQTRHVGFRALFRSSDKWVVHPRFCPVVWLDRLEQHIRWIGNNPEISVIHITRTDNLAWLKSYIFSRVTKNYIGKPYPEGLSVKINKREAIARVRSKQWLDGQLTRLTNSNPYLRVQYESLCEDKHGTGKSVVEFIRCEVSDYTIDEDMIYPKQSKGTTREGIKNYDELVSEFMKRDLIEGRFSSSAG